MSTTVPTFEQPLGTSPTTPSKYGLAVVAPPEGVQVGAPGQVYVALSRVVSMAELALSSCVRPPCAPHEPGRPGWGGGLRLRHQDRPPSASQPQRLAAESEYTLESPVTHFPSLTSAPPPTHTTTTTTTTPNSSRAPRSWPRRPRPSSPRSSKRWRSRSQLSGGACAPVGSSPHAVSPWRPPSQTGYHHHAGPLPSRSTHPPPNPPHSSTPLTHAHAHRRSRSASDEFRSKEPNKDTMPTLKMPRALF